MEPTFSEIVDLRDPLILPWLDLLETAFPPSERSLVSAHLEDLIIAPSSSSRRKHRLAAVDAGGQLSGMARYSYIRDIPLIYLIHLAVVPEQRSRGIGAQLFEEVRRRVMQSYPDVQLIAWEVERPEAAGTPEDRLAAERRIAFYERLGAKRVYGVDYIVQNRPELPQVPMHIMLTTVRRPDLDQLPQADVLKALQAHFGFQSNGLALQIG